MTSYSSEASGWTGSAAEDNCGDGGNEESMGGVMDEEVSTDWDSTELKLEETSTLGLGT